jgi:hypothetical protein
MITIAKLRRKPRHFRAFTGLSVAEFDTLLAHVAPAYEAAELAKRQRPQRQGALGSGHPFRLALSERLLMGLMYLRLYVRQSLLGYLFDLDESNISRELHDRLLPILLEVLPTPLRDAPLRHLASDTPADMPASQDTQKPADKAGQEKRQKRIGTLEELFAAYPEIKEVLLDATEQSVPQPKDKLKRKLAYSGKQQDHTVKTQIVATKTAILHVFGNLPGCLSDMLVLRASGVLRQMPPKLKVRLDKGYEGTDSAYPALAVQQPIKKKPKQLQNVLERAYNYMLSTQRIYVEPHFARLHKWDCLAQVWRGKSDAHEDAFCVVAGLLNFRQSGHLELMG